MGCPHEREGDAGVSALFARFPFMEEAVAMLRANIPIDD
jgi:hypothetical protein